MKWICFCGNDVYFYEVVFMQLKCVSMSNNDIHLHPRASNNEAKKRQSLNHSTYVYTRLTMSKNEEIYQNTRRLKYWYK